MSQWLYGILESVRRHEKLRLLHRQNAVTEEILSTISFSFMQGKLFNIYICGSRYDGSAKPDKFSDKDVVCCFSHMSVVLDAAAAPAGNSFLMVRDTCMYPGYVKLQLVKDGQPLDYFHWLYTKGYKADTVGRICVEHIELRDFFKKGPAFRQLGTNGEVLELEIVPAYGCDDIPQYALEWIMRPRPYEWPSREQLQTMSRMGCMVVGVGHVNSCEREIEWRMSYTLQERFLMLSLYPVQHRVYTLLKKFKSYIARRFVEIIQGIFSSYQCKTCVLYAVQMSPARVWTQDNIISCLVFCLKLLIKWFESEYIPNFFIKDQNMFKRKWCGSLNVRIIIESGHQFMYMLQHDNFRTVLRNCDWRMYREVTTYENNDYIFKLKLESAIVICTRALKILRFMSNEKYDPFTLTLVLEYLKNARHINTHTVEVTQSAMVHLFPWLHLHIANGLASFTHTCPDRAVRRHVMKLVDFHLHEARGIDLVNERLSVASVLYIFENYEECSLLLHLIESDFTYQVILVCPCSGRYTAVYYDIRDRHARKKKIVRMSVSQCIKSMTVCCVIFLPSATVIAPKPIQYEMQRSQGTLPGSRDEQEEFWFDWAVVDAKVYLYFLQYLVNSKLHKDVHREVARDNLLAEIAEDHQRVTAGQESRLGHKETAYNLLGWIYMQEEHLAEAYGCFHASWKIRPFHNAAKYHMRDMLVRLAERRVQH